jgi:GNAT superfamily N-acetyltransferase
MTNPRTLKVGEQALIGDIIGHSFADDPVNQWVFGGRECMTKYYTKMAKKLYLTKGFGHVTDDQTGGSLWLRPSDAKQVPLIKSIDIAFSMLRHNGFKSILRGMGVDDGLANKKPSEPHFYLFAIGSRPEHQGKGVGSIIMQAGLEIVDQAAMPAYLESSKESNLPFYQRFGFEVTEKVVPAQGLPTIMADVEAE